MSNGNTQESTGSFQKIGQLCEAVGHIDWIQDFECCELDQYMLPLTQPLACHGAGSGVVSQARFQ